MQHVLLIPNMSGKLARIIHEAKDGDTVVCPTAATVELGELASQQLCPDKRLTFTEAE